MKWNRQQVLLALLGVIGCIRVGEYVLISMIEEPLQQRRNRIEQLNKEIGKKQSSLAAMRKSGGRLDDWKSQSLPSDPEVARTVYRSWLMKLVRSASLQNAVVDSGSPTVRRGRKRAILLRTMPFSLRARGTLKQFTQVLFEISRTGLLHRISGFTLNPVGSSGQFDLSMSIETLLLAGQETTRLNAGSSGMPALSSASDYSVITTDNPFGIGLDTVDPMAHTMVTGITYSNGKPLVWITEILTSRVSRATAGESFQTVAMDGTIIEVRDEEVVVESGEQRLLLPIGKPFLEARRVEAASE
jgi:hypothetical protein